MNETTPVSPPQPGQCIQIKPDGSRCKANVRVGSDYCFFHDPDSALEREAARISGGKERSRRVNVLPAETPDVPLATAADVISLLAETIGQVRRGQLDHGVANCVGYLASTVLKAQQRDDLDQRVKRLEDILARQQASHAAHCEFEFVNPQSGG